MKAQICRQGTTCKCPKCRMSSRYKIHFIRKSSVSKLNRPTVSLICLTEGIGPSCRPNIRTIQTPNQRPKLHPSTWSHSPSNQPQITIESERIDGVQELQNVSRQICSAAASVQPTIYRNSSSFSSGVHTNGWW